MHSRVHPAGPPAANIATPVPGHQRNRSLDIIRGVAVFGLIWVNAQAMSNTGATADKVSSWFKQVFAAGKFWTLFSILFGVTLAMQLERATARGEKITVRWLRRMVALFGIGAANAILFFPGDILRSYAIAGVVLLLFNKASQRVVLIAAALFWLHGLANQLSMLLLAGGYLCALLVLLKRPAWQDRLRWLAAAGRMGLTNYVVQLALLTTLQAAYGFGLLGKLGSLMWTLVACAILLVQVVYSNYWLSRFQYGRLEWLWRKATYWRASRA